MDIRRFDIILADLSGSKGSEQGGIRPMLIVQSDRGNIFSTTTIAMPLSSKIKNLHQPTHTLIRSNNHTKLKTDSLLLGEQMRVISNCRIVAKIGTVVDKDERKAIKKVFNACWDGE